MTLKKLDLSGGTGGRGGQNTYTAPNGVVVKSGAPTYGSGSFYWMEYMFNDTKDGSGTSYWLSSGGLTYLTFDLQAVIGNITIKEIKVWPRTRNDTLTNYAIEVSDDGITWRPLVPFFTNSYSYPYSYFNSHPVEVSNAFIRFVLNFSGSWGASLNEIEFWYEDIKLLIEDNGNLKTYKQVPTKVSGSLSYDGTVAPHAMVQEIAMPVEEFMIEQWIHPEDIAKKYWTTFSYGNSSVPNALSIGRYAEKLSIYIENSIYHLNGMNLPHDKFSHIAIGWRSNDGYLQLYINGKLEYEDYGIKAGYSLPSKGFFVIGQKETSFGSGFVVANAFNGRISDTRIWNRILSPTEIKNLYKNNPAGTENGLVYWWDMSAEFTKSPVFEMPAFTSNTSGKMSVSSNTSYANQHPYYAVDKNMNTYWLSNNVPNASNPAWLLIDLGEFHTFIGYRMSISGGGTYNILTHHFQVSDDGINFRTAYSREGQVLYDTMTRMMFEPVRTRYVRILITQYAGSSGLVSIRELELIPEGDTIVDKVSQKKLNIYNTVIEQNSALVEETKLVTVGTAPPTSELFEAEGFSDSEVINTSELESSNPVLLIYRPREETIYKIKETVVPFPQLLFSNVDADITLAESIDWIRLDATLGGNGDIRAIVSFDQGVTWKYYDDTVSSWQVIDPQYLNVANIKYVGMRISSFNTIPSEKWNEGRGESDKVRLAFYLSIEKSTDVASIDSLKILFDQFGVWRHDSEAAWKYKDTELIVTVKNNGNYKINYYD